MGNTMKKVLSMLLGFGLVSILLYSVIYIVSTSTPSLAIPPKQVTPTPSPTPSPTPTTPPPTVTPTPTPTPTTPTTGRLEVQTIPQDDQLRKKGIIYTGLDSFSPDFHAEYKIDIRQDGVNVDADIRCIVLHKDVINPKVRQPGLISEEEVTEVTDVSEFCECFFRRAPGVPGVGVIDLYCEFLDDFFLGDHILKVVAERDGAVGSEIQDLCVLAAPTCAFFPGPFIDGTQCQDFSKDEGFVFSLEANLTENIHAADPIFPFASCKSAALFQRAPQPSPPVDPCAELADVAECPCDFDSVPKTATCWPPSPNFHHCDHAQCEAQSNFEPDVCVLIVEVDSLTQQINVFSNGSSVPNNNSCTIFVSTLNCEAVPVQTVQFLSPEAYATCICRLEQYTNELSQAGISITDSGPPFSCEPPPPPP